MILNVVVCFNLGIIEIKKIPIHLSILVVDDDFVMQRIIVALLNGLGHSGVIVDDGSKAIACLAQRSFDVVLMDVMMPVMDGLKALALIREHEKITFLHQPIIMLTGHSEPNDVTRLNQAGADGYVQKPIDLSELNAELNRVVSQIGRVPPIN